MKVYVSQGHERGIGLEVFLKSCLMLSPSKINNIELIAYPDTITENLKRLGLHFKHSEQGIEAGDFYLKVRTPSKLIHSQSFSALLEAMKLAEKDGVLFTLPTSKDQFPSDPGHTEFFRRHYHRPELGMFFASKGLNLLLITDHKPISSISNELGQQTILSRIEQALKALKGWDWPINRIFIAGLNPHAGEEGLIGTEDERVAWAVKKIRSKYPYDVSGPWPGDTMLLEQKSQDDLMIYLYHDQGLGVFKTKSGFIGANITLGLPYPRVSPDHGTAFALYGKNQADYRGCAFALNLAIDLLKRVKHGKDSSH
jgi:4-hydroxythreonine-4-phosphate dehydrogenase